MNERRYSVMCLDDVLASNMMIDDALMFIKAYYEKYYNERDLVLTIMEMPQAKVGSEND